MVSQTRMISKSQTTMRCHSVLMRIEILSCRIVVFADGRHNEWLESSKAATDWTDFWRKCTKLERWNWESEMVTRKQPRCSWSHSQLSKPRNFEPRSPCESMHACPWVHCVSFFDRAYWAICALLLLCHRVRPWIHKHGRCWGELLGGVQGGIWACKVEDSRPELPSRLNGNRCTKSITQNRKPKNEAHEAQHSQN